MADRPSTGDRGTVGAGGPAIRRTRACWVIGLTIVALVSVALPAFAGVPANEPANCNTHATDGWYWSCWVSNNASDPDRISDLSTGIQTVLTYNDEASDNPGGIDGYFGSNSYTGTRWFQQNHGLTVDGIVGSNTWNWLEQDVDWKASYSGYHWYEVENYNVRYVFRRVMADDNWDVQRYKNGSWTWVAMDRTRT